MSMPFRRAVPLAVLAVLVLPVAARADGLLSWLGRLSGPGPFLGGNVSVCVTTTAKGDEQPETVGLFFSCKNSRLEKRHTSIYVDAGAGLAWANELDYSGQDIAGKSERVTYLKAGGSVMYTAAPALDLGVGAGVMVFNGPRFSSFVSPYIQPIKVAVRPLLLGRPSSGDEMERRGWLMLTASWMILLDTIDGAKFGAPADPLRERYENLPQFGVAVDVPRLLRATRPK
jgi:hypothetical protein